jgi:Flp pilus assembly protein TadG
MKVKLPCRRLFRTGRVGENGQSLVELALVLPLLVVFLLGAVEIGQFAYESIEVANAAKAGIQYGAQNRATAADSTGIQSAAANDAANLNGLVTTSSYSCTCSNSSYTPSSCTDNTTCSSNNSQIEVTLKVNTSVSFKSLIHIPNKPSTITLYGQAVQKVLN